MAPKRQRLSASSSILDSLEPLGAPADIRPVVYKTVETFSGIVQRKLWLKHDEYSTAKTDGRCITVNLNDEDVYAKVEHELSHILFQSDPLAKVKFVETYCSRIQIFAEKHAVKVGKKPIAELLDFILNILEDRRVDTLWATLYPGSAKVQRKLHFDLIQEYAPVAHSSFMLYFACVESEVPTPPGPLDRYRPLFQQALAKVERKGFVASLVLAKWLVTSLVSEIIAYAVEQNPPSVSVDAANKPAEASDLGSSNLSPSDSDHVVVDAAPAEGGGPNAAPPTARAKALQVLARQSKIPDELRDDKNDLVPTEYKERGADAKADQLVSAVLQADLSSEQLIDQLLEPGSREMEAIATKARQAIRPPASEDDWIRKDAMAKVNFYDITPSDTPSKPVKPLSAEDLDYTRKLRGFFLRVMGNRRTVLDDSGLELDIPSLIEQRLSKEHRPCFKREEAGRGFKSLILLDRSSSMEGVRSLQAERACRIIRRAMKFPFVTTDVWGFQSIKAGEVDIPRFSPGVEGFTTERSPVTGCTPLHTAIKLATKYLEQGAESKQLIIITDGEPHHLTKSGSKIPTSQLHVWVREAVSEARKQGINVTCLMISSKVSPEKLKKMFGPPHTWKTVNEDKLGSDLIRLVSGSFVKYLRAR